MNIEEKKNFLKLHIHILEKKNQNVLKAKQLKKEYQQDEELTWGCLVDKKFDNKLQTKELGPTFKKRK